MILEKIKKRYIHDGKVVMVELYVVDKETRDLIVTVGRATCDLTEDVFNLETGIALAEDRAYQKAIKKSLKQHKSEFEFYTYMAKKEKEIVDLISKKLKL